MSSDGIKLRVPRSPKDSGILRDPSKDSSIIRMPRPRGDRREEVRSQLAQELPALLSCNEQTFPVFVKDVARHGAGLRLARDTALAVGMTGTLTVETAWETASRKCRVAWVWHGDDAAFCGLSFVDVPKDADCIGLLNMDKVKIDPACALRIPATLALRRQVLPFAFADGYVYVACASLLDTAALHAVEKLVTAPVRPEPSDLESLKRALDRVYGEFLSPINGVATKPRSVDLRSLAELVPEDTIALCDELMHAAILRQASDIHLDPDQNGLQVRLRVDGVLEAFRTVPPTLQSGLLSRFKVLCGMDIAEKRAPQDGGFKHRYGRAGQAIDIRGATLPTKFGERMTLRLLSLQTESLTLERLGMREQELSIFSRCLEHPHGLILLTGPTGSGKTTTLYAAIRRLLDMENLNILTVEDPIEYEIKGVAQVQVDAADKVTFLKALRSVLRHDPDVVMIGEIRDEETADVAIKASLTGHLVFSTLHTNSAVSVITRLADMKVDRFLIAATLRLAVAQRLVRQLCPRCRKPRELKAHEAAALLQPDLTGRIVYEPGGCIYCAGKGYQGRVGLFELLPLDEEWSRAIARGVDEAELLERMRADQVTTLMQDGRAKLLSGVTSVREVLGAVTVW